MSTDPKRSLDNILLFKDLAPEVVSEVSKLCHWRDYAAHEEIIGRDSKSKDVYFITKGRVRVLNYSMSGREIAFDDITEGSFFGELAALDGEPRSANIVAIEPTTAALMTPDSLERVIEAHPSIARILMKRMAAIIRTSVDRIMDLSTLGANNRVYAELLRLAKDNENDQGISFISPVPIHGDIASRVSTTRETVARVLSDLNKKQVVSRQGKKLVIHDMDRLREMVEQFRGE